MDFKRLDGDLRGMGSLSGEPTIATAFLFRNFPGCSSERGTQIEHGMADSELKKQPGSLGRPRC